MFGKAMFVYLLIVMIICGGCQGGEVYKVGGSSGWTNIDITPFYYKSWAASLDFHVGDTLLFEYNKEFHNVVRVTHNNFNSCNSTAPYATWASGNDSFTITRPGHFYFICSLPGHCRAGQKVDIRVVEHGPAPSPLPSGPSAPSPSPLSGPSLAPAPSPKKSGSSSLRSSCKVWLLLVAFALASIAS